MPSTFSFDRPTDNQLIREHRRGVSCWASSHVTRLVTSRYITAHIRHNTNTMQHSADIESAEDKAAETERMRDIRHLISLSSIRPFVISLWRQTRDSVLYYCENVAHTYSHPRSPTATMDARLYLKTTHEVTEVQSGALIYHCRRWLYKNAKRLLNIV